MTKEVIYSQLLGGYVAEQLITTLDTRYSHSSHNVMVDL